MFRSRPHMPRGPLHRLPFNGPSDQCQSRLNGVAHLGKDSCVERSPVSCSFAVQSWLAAYAEPYHREALSRNVAIWIWLTRIFAAAIPNLTTRSVGPLASLNDPDKGVTPQESTALIVKNYQGLKDDLQILNKLMHIARNLLVTTEPEVPQDLCAAVHFDQMVYQTIILCVNVTSKGYDGEVLDENSRQRLNEITELCKRPGIP